MQLTQEEANRYLLMPKTFETRTPLKLGLPGLITRELVSDDGRERFRLETWFHTAMVTRYKYQNMVRLVVPLVRLCAGSSIRHTNPDGTVITGSHLHLYREGDRDHWATPLTDCGFSNASDFALTLREFCRYCNIINLPELQLGLL